jgi:hypothetical protein
LLLLATLLAVPGHAVLFKDNGDPSYNTNAPTGSLTNSGWQYEGQWDTGLDGYNYLGTPIAPRFFAAAQHVGGTNGEAFVYNGFTYHTVAVFDCPNSDLRIWQVAETFPRYAPLYTKSNEVGSLCVAIGRGTQRGSAVAVLPQTNGWQYGANDTVKRWGENSVASIYTSLNLGQFLYCTFDRNGTSNECHLSSGDSSGGMFIEDSGTWKLAGLHYSVDGPFSLDGTTNTQFRAALLDVRGLYYENSTGGWTFVSTQGPVLPSGFYSTRISAHISWINSVIDYETGPDLRVTGNQVVGADMHIDLSTGSNRLYRVDSTSDLVTGVWTTVTNNLNGTGGIVTIIDPGVGGQSQRFYRATILQ